MTVFNEVLNYGTGSIVTFLAMILTRVPVQLHFTESIKPKPGTSSGRCLGLASCLASLQKQQHNYEIRISKVLYSSSEQFTRSCLKLKIQSTR